LRKKTSQRKSRKTNKKIGNMVLKIDGAGMGAGRKTGRPVSSETGRVRRRGTKKRVRRVSRAVLARKAVERVERETEVVDKLHAFFDLWKTFGQRPEDFDWLFLFGLGDVIVRMLVTDVAHDDPWYFELVEKSATFMTPKYITNFVSVLPTMVDVLTEEDGPYSVSNNFPVMVLDRFREDMSDALSLYSARLRAFYAENALTEGYYVHYAEQMLLFNFIEHK